MTETTTEQPDDTIDDDVAARRGSNEPHDAIDDAPDERSWPTRSPADEVAVDEVAVEEVAVDESDTESCRDEVVDGDDAVADEVVGRSRRVVRPDRHRRHGRRRRRRQRRVADEDVAAVEVDDPWTRPGSWYVVHTQSGYEKKVTANLHARIQSMNMEDKIFEVVIPMEEVVEFKNGRRQTVQRKVFPGYLLVRCVMDDESWYCVRNTPGVTGFVGQSRQGQKPTPLSRARGGHVPRRQGRRRRAVGAAEAEARLRRRRERPGPRRDRSPTSRARSPRSTPITSSSRFSSTSSGARRSSRWTSARSPSSDEHGCTADHKRHRKRDTSWQRRNSRRS